MNDHPSDLSDLSDPGGRTASLMHARLLKFKLTIAYDGTGYEGWQVQKIGTGVQEKIEEALAKLFPSLPRLHSSSRTDTGVHALGMVAHFEVASSEIKLSAARLG